MGTGAAGVVQGSEGSGKRWQHPGGTIACSHSTKVSVHPLYKVLKPCVGEPRLLFIQYPIDVFRAVFCLPASQMCKNVMNCDPYATKAASATPVPMTTEDPSSMIWPDPTEMQFLLSRNITFCESLQCSPTIPVPPLPQFCLDLFSMLPLPP